MDLNLMLSQIIEHPELHFKWLNTLSFLENCGARKIAACEHPTLVKEEMLKHAAEEFRHAHHLKRQIEKITLCTVEDYSLPFLLGGIASLHYLNTLDVRICRYLSKKAGLAGNALKSAAYLLVTYTIELRAEELYPLYDAALRKVKSSVTVKSILLEEKEHLEEMRSQLEKIPFGAIYAKRACALEQEIYECWQEAIFKDVLLLTHLSL